MKRQDRGLIRVMRTHHMKVSKGKTPWPNHVDKRYKRYVKKHHVDKRYAHHHISVLRKATSSGCTSLKISLLKLIQNIL
jgi:hypothetical protein